LPQNSEDEIRKSLQKVITPILKDGNPKNRTNLFNLLKGSGIFNKEELELSVIFFSSPARKLLDHKQVFIGLFFFAWIVKHIIPKS
jgi:hypothetical protein